MQPLARMQTGLYASRSYAEAHGLPENEAAFEAHRFVATDNIQNRAPFFRWLGARVSPDRITFRSSELATLEMAVRHGMGIGFMSAYQAKTDPDLIEVMPPRPEWEAPLWLVTHVDLHRTKKVQAFLKHLKEAAAVWDI